MSLFRCLFRTKVISPGPMLSVWLFRSKIRFYGENVAPRPTPKLVDHTLSALRNCLFNIFATTLHIGSRSSIRNLRTRHAVVTGTNLSQHVCMCRHSCWWHYHYWCHSMGHHTYWWHYRYWVTEWAFIAVDNIAVNDVTVWVIIPVDNITIIDCQRMGPHTCINFWSYTG